MSLKFIIARRSVPLRQQLAPFRARHLLPPAQTRCASASAPSKKHMLEKPSKYTPPSHPARFKKQDLPKHYGGELSALQKKLQRRKRYPNMFPDEGTFLFWFLTQRWLHAFIALSVLFAAAGYTWYQDWTMRSPESFAALPSLRDLTNPRAFLEKCYEAVRLNLEHNSVIAEAQRQRRDDDAQKRRAYRLVHGLDAPDSSGVRVGEFGPVVGAVDPVHGGPRESRAAWKAWWHKDRAEEEGRLARQKMDQLSAQKGESGESGEGEASPPPAPLPQAPASEIAEQGEQPRRRKPKKWLGIWE